MSGSDNVGADPPAPRWVTSGERWVPEWMRRLVASTLIDKVERDHQQSDAEFRRRRIIVLLVLIVGATLLGISLNVRPGSAVFYPLTLAVAATWIIGGFLSGPLHLGYLPFRGQLERPIRSGFVVGLIAGAVFLGGALLVKMVPPLQDFVQSVLDHAKYGSLIPVTFVTLVNGIGEEVFFRGGLFAAIGRKYPVVISTSIYAIATIATLNPMLVFSAITLGLVLALQRRASGGILAPIITHCTWSMIMLFVLPPLFGSS